MAIDFKLPDLGENIETGDIVNVLVNEGDQITADQNVLEVETGKAVIELPCPHAGRITKLHVKKGSKVKPGDSLLTLETGAPSAAAPAKAVAAPAPAAQAAAAQPAPAAASPAPVAAPPQQAPAAAAAAPKVKSAEPPHKTPPAGRPHAGWLVNWVLIWRASMAAAPADASPKKTSRPRCGSRPASRLCRRAQPSEPLRCRKARMIAIISGLFAANK